MTAPSKKCTVFANARGISHKGSGALNTVFPDVCLTPIGKASVPIPYANTAEAPDIAQGPQSVQVDGSMPFVRAGVHRRTYGDEPGRDGGVLSGVHLQIAEALSYSFDVKFEGRNVCRLGDLMFHNKKNAAG